VAELTLAMMLALARKVFPANQHAHTNGWERQRFMGTELYGKNFGVVGLGRIGFLTATRARALGMNILAHDNYISPDAVAVAETHAELLDLNTLLSRSDFVSCHIPLTPETRNFFNYERFCKMKPTAFFLNLARGEVVDEMGLLQALKESKIAGAGLDVREQEPPASAPFAGMENVILTPHIAAMTREAQERVVASVCQDVAAVLAGGAAKNFVNFPKPKRV
jgi:D-3-phosphoglycerate dehydrogenase